MVTISPSPIPPAPPRTVPRHRSDAIESLRALAALWVVCSHIWILEFGPAAHRGLLGWMSNWLLYSHLAVDVFIVLSGYCLSLATVRDGGLRGGMVGFWQRRARRLLPPLYLSLVFSIGITLLLQTLDQVPRQLDRAALGVNIFLLQDLVLNENVFNSPLWSVAVEWRLSLLFPVLSWLLWRRGAKTLLLATAVAGYAVTAVILQRAPQMLLACPWYLILFALGMCAASNRQGWVSPELTPAPPWGRWALGLGAALALIGLLWAYPVSVTGMAFGRHMPLIDAAAGILTALLLFGLRQEEREPRAGGTPGMAWLTCPALVALGRFSYSLYLTHSPLLRLLERLLRALPFWAGSPALLRVALLTGLGLPLLIGLAYVFFMTCERPFIPRRTYLLVPAGQGPPSREDQEKSASRRHSESSL